MEAPQPLALVVDDNPLILMEAGEILREAGYDCRTVDTGDDAKVLLQDLDGKVDLVFSDIEMPGSTDGIALACFICDHWPDVQIVLASGAVMCRDDELPGNTTFVPKPFDASIVHDHLRRKIPDDRLPPALAATGA